MTRPCSHLSYGGLAVRRLEKEEVFWHGHRDCFKASKYKFTKVLREVQQLYSNKLQQYFSVHDSASVCIRLRQLTNYKPKAHHSTNNSHPANSLNSFYCHLTINGTVRFPAQPPPLTLKTCGSPNPSPPPLTVHSGPPTAHPFRSFLISQDTFLHT